MSMMFQGSSVQSTSLRRAEHSQTPISGMQFIAAKSIFRLSRSENLTAAGYNLQVSDIIISTRSGLPLKIYTSGQYRYVDVPANDTVLITTVESIFVGPQIMGTFHSRVSIVSQGFGHISTTLDPTWCGPLLIAVNNPIEQEKKICNF